MILLGLRRLLLLLLQGLLLLKLRGCWKERWRCHCWETLVANACASPVGGRSHPSFNGRSGAPLVLLNSRRRIRRRRRGSIDLDGATPGSSLRKARIDSWQLTRLSQGNPLASSLGTIVSLANDL